MTTASIPIDMYQMRKEDGFSQLGMRDSAIMFYGVLAKTILDIISQNLATQLSPDFQQKLEETARVAVKEYISKNYPIRVEDFKRCSKCKLDNEYKNKFCGECGTKLAE